MTEAEMPKKDWRSQTKKATVFVLGYLTAFLFLIVFISAMVEGFQNDSYLRWINLAAFLLDVALIAFLIYKNKKRSPWDFVRLIFVSLAFLIVYSSFFYSTSDVKAFTLLGRPTESLLNPIFLTVLLALIAVLWTQTQLPRWLKIAGTMLLAYLASAFLYGLFRNVGLEESFLGVDLFGYIPWYFLQPTYLTIQFVFPFVFVLAAISWFRKRKTDPRMAKLFLGVFSLVLITDAIGFVAMTRNRVPNLFSLIFSPPLGVGEASTTFLSPAGKTTSVRITTRDYAQERNKESALFYSLALSYQKSEGDKRLFGLSVKDATGKDILFLDKNDFEIFEDNHKQDPIGIDFELGGIKTGQNVILVLDHSGSMSAVIDQLKLAAKAFVDLKNRNDQILLIPFESKPHPQEVSKDKEILKKQIDSIKVGGGTGLYQAILLGYDLSEKFSGSTTMVVMTDGAATDQSTEHAKRLSERLASKKLRIYSVGLGKGTSIDETFLKRLAQEGGGKYYSTEDASKLKDIYKSIGAELQSKYTAWYTHQALAPEIQITTPEKNSIITSPTPFVATVLNASETQIEKVEFFVDDQKVAEQPGTTQPTYSYPLDFQKLATGKHALKVVATSVKKLTGQDQTEIEVRPAVELSFIRPGEGDTVGGLVPVEAKLVLHSPQTLTQIEFSADGVVFGLAPSAPFQANWDTQSVPAGEHILQAKATFSDGSSQSAQIKVKVGKEMSIQWTNPQSGTELSGIVPLSISIQNENQNDRVVSVQYWVEDAQVGSSNTAPFSFNWDTTNLKTGAYLLKAIAQTQSGKTANASLTARVSVGKLLVNLAGAETGSEGDKAKFFFPPENVEIILDVSNSMWAQLSEGTKIDIAKQVLSRIIEQVPEQTKVALRVYGSKSPVGRNDCKDSELLIPPGPLNRQQILQKIQGLSPKGKTPIAYSLAQAVQDFPNSQASRLVLLITDGVESCGGDPAQAAASLAKMGVKTKVHVIGYDVPDPKESEALAAIAKAGGGKYFMATSSEQLSDAIMEAATVTYRVLDKQGNLILQDAVGNTLHELKSGTYKLVIDLESPLTLDPVVITPDRSNKIMIQKQGAGYQLLQQ